MKLSDYYMGVIAVRVCIHKFEFASARMISLGVGFDEKMTPCFSRKDSVIFSKYTIMVCHHDLMRLSVAKSQHMLEVSTSMIFSTVSAQWRLYGIT
jgi:hypothetical protein